MNIEPLINDAIKWLRCREPSNYYGPYIFHSGGTGLSDEYWIEYWKESDVIVITRDFKRYLKGRKVEG